MKKKILYIFTRTPLHVGAGASVGAVDQPIIRERHTGFPIIPASSLKGTFADEWNEQVTVKQQGENGSVKEVTVIQRSANGKWLFGETDADKAMAGALLFTEGRLLAFPVRSAKGSFAWITCPLILRRAKRDGVLSTLPDFKSPSDTQALFDKNSPLSIDNKLVLEEYTFENAGELPESLSQQFNQMMPEDPVWAEVGKRLVILSDGMMSFFAQNACEISQHVRINDETGTAAHGALFNQENVPSETLFYSVINALAGRGPIFKNKTPDDALKEFESKVNGKIFQFGGDASTGLGWCTIKLTDPYN